MDSNWECLFKAQNGNESSCSELFKLYQVRLMALALLITGSTTAAEDVVQETFIRAFGAKIRNTAGSVQGFLATIAYRLAVRESKRTRRNSEFDDLEPCDQKPDPLENVLCSERDQLVARAITSLDRDHRDALILKFYGDNSYDEIADLLSIPVGTVKSRVFYAVKNCREILRQQGVLE